MTDIDKDFTLRIAEAYARALALHDILQQVAEKLQEDPTKKSTKTKSTLSGTRTAFNIATDALESLRNEADDVLEGCVLLNRDVTNMEKSIKRLLSIRSKLEGDELTRDDLTKWLDDLTGVKTALSRRFQIRRVDSEKQASISSLTEQLKQRDKAITRLEGEKFQVERDLIDLTTKLSKLTEKSNDATENNTTEV